MDVLSRFPSHDYPEYETPSEQYENGPIAYFEVSPAFEGRIITLGHPDETHIQKYGKIGKIPVPLTRT